MSLMKLEDFDSDSRWIATRLGISTVEAKAAIERLERLKLITMKGQKLVRLAENLTTTHDVPLPALRLSHKQSLEQAIESLESVPVELRDISSITMAIDPDLVPQAKKLILRFRRSLSRFLEAGRKREVYNLNIQLVPVTKTNGKK